MRFKSEYNCCCFNYNLCNSLYSSREAEHLLYLCGHDFDNSVKRMESEVLLKCPNKLMLNINMNGNKGGCLLWLCRSFCSIKWATSVTFGSVTCFLSGSYRFSSYAK